MTNVKVKVPATSANLGPGFDSLGMAFSLYNIVEMEVARGGFHITVEGEGAEAIPRDERNIVIKSALKVFAVARRPVPGLKIRLMNQIPLSRGLGSSAAAIVGGLLAANALCGQVLSRPELLSFATALEGHPDNVTPALLGGVTVAALDGGEVRYIRIDPPTGLRAVVAIPEFTLSTRTARKVLPEKVSFGDAVFNVSRTALLVAALCTGNLGVLTTAMEDRLHQPYRASLIPGMEEVFAAAKAAGALATAISGAGPTLIAFVQNDAKAVADAMVAGFAAHSIRARAAVLTADTAGAVVVNS